MTTKRSDARAAAFALAAATFGAAAPLAYLGQRLYERARSAGPVDPAMVLRQAHTAFYWRAATAAWWAGIAAALVFAWAARRTPDDVTPRGLRFAVAPLVLAVLALAWRFA